GRKVRFVQNTEHDLFAVDSRHDGHAQVIVFATDTDPHAPVLGQPAFGDVQAAHDFEARCQGQLHLLGRWRGVDEHTIDAVTQAQPALKRFDVNVARAIFDCLDQDQVGQFDDRSLFAGGGQLIEIDFLDGVTGYLEVLRIGIDNIALRLGVLDDVLHAP